MARAGARQVRLQRWISEVSWRYGGCRLLLEPPVAANQLAGGNRRGTKSAPALALCRLCLQVSQRSIFIGSDVSAYSEQNLIVIHYH